MATVTKLRHWSSVSLHTRDAQPAFECLRRHCQVDDDAGIRLPQYYLADHFDNLDKFT